MSMVIPKPGEHIAIGNVDLIGGGREWRKVHAFIIRDMQSTSGYIRLCDGEGMNKPAHGWSVDNFKELRAKFPNTAETICLKCEKANAKGGKEASA